MIKIFGNIVIALEILFYALPIIFNKQVKEDFTDLKHYFWDERPRTWKEFKKEIF